MTNQKLYAMRDTATGHIKIGISKHPQVRAYQLGGMVRSEVVLLMERDAKNAEIAEKFTHRELKPKNVRGEWFALDADDLAELTSLFDAACDLETLPPRAWPEPVTADEGTTRWKLGSYLEANNITVYELAKHTKGKLSRNALYRLSNEAPTQVRLNTFDALIPALKRVTGKDVQLSDLLEYQDDGPDVPGEA